MLKISKIMITQLFWDTLEQQRNHSKYREFRTAINNCIKRKADDRTFTSKSDKPFSADPVLKGIWHCTLSRDPDLIFFYRMSGDTLICGMLGSHHDYGFHGKGNVTGHNMVSRIDHSIEKGHKPLANWSTVRWNRPSDLINSIDLHEASTEALDRVLAEIDHESSTLSLLGKAHGPVNDLPPNVYGPWIDELQVAHNRVIMLQNERRLMLKERREYNPAAFGLGGGVS
jgi:mRNA-degrading endonuclease YafQ of YafQ-DinJ toxin-antitoxin module